MVRQLQSWHANIAKRQVKSPKISVRDSGLSHQSLGIAGEKTLVSHPKLGAWWEGFVIEQVLATEPRDDAIFWGTQQAAAIDLILRRGDRLLAVECKRTNAPRMTPSPRIAATDLELERVAVAYPGTRRYAVADAVEAVPLAALVLLAKTKDAFIDRGSSRQLSDRIS